MLRNELQVGGIVDLAVELTTMADQLSNEYYIARAIQARERALLAQSPAIAAIHQEMAVRYSELISRPVRDLAVVPPPSE